MNSYILNRKTFNTPLTSINISPDGKILLAGFHDGSIKLLDAGTFEVILEIEDAHFKAVNAMDMTPQMDLFLSAGHNTIKTWDMSGNHLDSWNAHATTIMNADISPDGKWVVSSAFNKTFLLWDLKNNALLEHMRGHDDIVLTVEFSPDSRRIASGSNDLTIGIWDLESRQLLKRFHGPTDEIYDVDFSPDGKLLAVASKDRSVRIYDLEKDSLIHLLKGHRDLVMEVDFSPDGRYLISGSADFSIMLWDVKTGERIHHYLDNEEAVLDLVFHPDGESFYSISYARDLTRWAIDPEIFVIHYFDEDYRAELEADPVFQSRKKGESKKEFQIRQEEADRKRTEIVDRYYRKYLQQRER